MTLNARFLVLITTLLLGSSLAILLVLPRVTEGIVEQWGLRLVETQVRYDSARLLHPVEREIALARRLAESPALRDWLRQPEQAQRRAAALAELEGFRRHFREHNYFVARSDSGAYYHNDAANRFAGRQLRYHWPPTTPPTPGSTGWSSATATSTSTSTRTSPWASPSCGSTSRCAMASEPSASSAPD